MAGTCTGTLAPVMGGKGSGAKKRKAAAPPETLKAQGTGGKKRTPTSAFDPAAGASIYEPEKIVAERLARGVTQYMVKWAGYDTKDNTWEPIENLAGCEDIYI